MGNFSSVLTQSQAEAIHAYVKHLTWEQYRYFKSLGASASSSTPTCGEPKANEKPVSLLVVTGSHPYEPSEFFSTFAAMPNVRYQHVLLSRGKPISYPPGGLGRYDVILFFDFEPGTVTPEWKSVLERGGGFVFLHHAIGTFPASPEIETIIGGHANFTKDVIPGVLNTTFHPNQRQHFTMTDATHPVTCGVGDFDMLDEAYDDFDVDPGAHILMTSDFPKATPAAAWTWSFEHKRALFIQPGHGSIFLPPDHGPSSYQSEPFKKLLARGIQWAAGRL